MGQMATHHNTTIYIPVSPLCLSPFYSPLRTKDNRKNHEQRIINNTTASSMFQLNLILYSLHCRAGHFIYRAYIGSIQILRRKQLYFPTICCRKVLQKPLNLKMEERLQ
ncbi:uncharacterized protein LOC133745663 isoform X1 [Rosa rugosa]|uniref:uncharacterized protein LOC133724613 isoform X1 n=1 Tax=Rosa rugosa TaxID=74645 RepID=UPI002B412F10|nr:uncharacterized protein LOC133724613 isoform X1 [Rosa rugosa]XP_062029753.1 uncharacterized protein LOC133745663 isoform X1 [Rosa rugosa]